MIDTPLNLVLSPREKDVLRYLMEGYTERGVALKLGISKRTVSVHTSNIRRKFGVRSITSAVAYAVNCGFLKE